MVGVFVSDNMDLMGYYLRVGIISGFLALDGRKGVMCESRLGILATDSEPYKTSTVLCRYLYERYLYSVARHCVLLHTYVAW